MDNAMMIGLARQMTLRRSMDIAANNIANMSTAGFKAEHELLAERPMGKARDAEGGEQIRYVADWGVLRDFRTGALEHTGRDFDLAIQGDGFFQIQVGDNIQYTRDGRFSVNAEGGLVTSDGSAVLDDGGEPIIFPPGSNQIDISPAGSVAVNGLELTRLGVMTFDRLSSLQKAGGGRITAGPDAGPVLVEAPDIRQGFYESSNVNPVLELTRMLEITRTYQSVSKMIEENSDLSRRSIERLGSVKG